MLQAMITRRLLLTASAALAGAAAAGQRATAAEKRPIVVELFTSQGCSSCPPADAFLGELAKRSDLLPLAFHVDYWDYIGWPDRFADRAWTARQRAYRQALGLRSIYTPQMVVDGRIDVVGSYRAHVERAISTAREKSSGTRLSLSRAADGGLNIEIAGNSGAAGEAELLLVTYDRRQETAVQRGENAGKKLVEYNIVRALSRVGAWRGGTDVHKVAAAALPDVGDQCVVLLQSPGPGPILAAAALPLR
jgi:hypothetical protein